MIDALVVGGGPAGTEAALRMARRGLEVVVLERERQAADKVCGEFLSHEAIMYLRASGLDLAALGAVPISALRVTAGAVVAETPLPFEALSLSRRTLDEALLRRAAEHGAQLQRGSKVVELSPRGGARRARLADGRTFDARAAFLATGKHDLRGHGRRRGLQNDLVAFKLQYKLEEAQAAVLERYVELVLFDGGYAGLQLIEQGYANFCLVVRRGKLARSGRQFEPLMRAILAESPHLQRRLERARPRWARPLALASIPYGYVRERAHGVFALGDQGAVIPSFSGDGISVALHSGRLAAQIFLAGGRPQDFQRALAQDVRAQVRLTSVLSHALVHRASQRALVPLVRGFPSLADALTLQTRIAYPALRRVGLLDDRA